jgi:4-hydroxybenzoate polyprenyltransferase
MGVLTKIKDHIMIGGPNGIAGWGLWLLLTYVSGVGSRDLRPRVDLTIFIPILIAVAMTGMGTYALNAYYDSAADEVNKPNRPIPSGRMSRLYALRYSLVLMALGMAISVVLAIVLNNFQLVILWLVFTFLGYAYSTPPLKLKSRNILGNLTFGAFATLTFFIDTLMSGYMITVNRSFWEILLLNTIYIGGLITMKDFYDVEGDRAAGDNTLPVKVGVRWAALFSMALMLIQPLYWETQWPSQNLSVFIDRNFIEVVYVVSFGIYILIDFVTRARSISDSYAKVQYYFVILYTAWSYVKRPFGLWGRSRSLTPLQAWIRAWERPLFIGLYAIFALVAMYRAWRRTKHA